MKVSKKESDEIELRLHDINVEHYTDKLVHRFHLISTNIYNIFS